MRRKVLLGGAVALVVAAGAWAVWTSGAWDLLGDEVRIAALVAEAGWLGPLVIVVLMTTAVVLSPIPAHRSRWPRALPTATSGAPCTS